MRAGGDDLGQRRPADGDRAGLVEAAGSRRAPSCSSAAPPFTTTPRRAARERPETIATGAARMSGHGVATTSTATARTRSPEIAHAAPASARLASRNAAGVPVGEPDERRARRLAPRRPAGRCPRTCSRRPRSWRAQVEGPARVHRRRCEPRRPRRARPAAARRSARSRRGRATSRSTQPVDRNHLARLHHAGDRRAARLRAAARSARRRRSGARSRGARSSSERSSRRARADARGLEGPAAREHHGDHRAREVLADHQRADAARAGRSRRRRAGGAGPRRPPTTPAGTTPTTVVDRPHQVRRRRRSRPRNRGRRRSPRPAVASHEQEKLFAVVASPTRARRYVTFASLEDDDRGRHADERRGDEQRHVEGLETAVGADRGRCTTRTATAAGSASDLRRVRRASSEVGGDRGRRRDARGKRAVAR